MFNYYTGSDPDSGSFGPKRFKPPTTVEEAMRRIENLTMIIKSIEAQLGDPDRRDCNGQTLKPRDFHAWRVEKIAELKKLKRKRSFLWRCLSALKKK